MKTSKPRAKSKQRLKSLTGEHPRRQKMLSAIEAAIASDALKPIPEEFLSDRKGVLDCVRAICECTRRPGGEPSDVYTATRILWMRCNNDVITWKQAATLLAKGIEYPTVYGLYSQARRSNLGDNSISESGARTYVDVVSLIADLAGDQPKPGATARSKDEAKHFPVWAAHEENVNNSTEIRKQLTRLSGGIQVQDWVFSLDLSWFIPMKNRCELWLSAWEAINKDAIRGLVDICQEHSIALIAAHPDHDSGRPRYSMRVARPLVTDDAQTFATWVRIPLYYTYSHFREKQGLDFAELKRWMGQSGRPMRQSRASGVAMAKAIMRESIARGSSKSEAWEEARQLKNWSESYMKSLVGPKPTG